MITQLEEHAEFELGARSEFINCLEEAQGVASTLNPELRRRATAAVEAGKIAIVTTACYFCKSTDALAGSYPVAVATADTLADAQAILEAMPYDDDLHVEMVIPDHLKPAPLAAPVVYDADEIPF